MYMQTKKEPVRSRLTPEKINNLLGTDISKEEMLEIFQEDRTCI